MDKKQNRWLGALSHMDDEIVEKQTHQRILLLSGVKRRRFTKRLWISVGSMAAALLLVLSSLLVLIPLLSKQVPIYTGMTVSGKNDTPTLSYVSDPLQYAAPGTNNGNHYGQYKGDYAGREETFEEMQENPLEDHLLVTGGAQSFYTAKPGETVLITVHFNNPDDFEILSFTLNGEKYASHMFRDGSDMENIIVEVNVGDTEGVVEYTIDAIKYVDGTEIKDVRMEGDATVRIGIAANTQPTTTVTSEKISFDSVSFDLVNEDEFDLITLSNGTLTAVLYDGNEILFKKDLLATENASVSFDGLSPNRVYQYAVIAHYDAFDGNGVADHILVQKTFRTACPVLFDGITVGISSLSFSYLWDEQAADSTISASLWQNGIQIRDIGAATAISNLLPNTAYTLVASYRVNGKIEQITLEFTTDPLIYTVRYLLESPEIGSYALTDEQSVSLEPGAAFAPEVIMFEGFTSPNAIVRTASVDDPNPVVEYHYTRNSYSISFMSGGSMHADTLRYGETLPSGVREGFVFLGWFDANGTQYTTVPAKNIALYARYSQELTAEDFFYSGSTEITITGLKNLAVTELVIPAYINGARVTGIGAQAFKDNTLLTSVTLPSTLQTVGAGAFTGCSGLRSTYYEGTLADWCGITFEKDSNVQQNEEFLYPAEYYAANPIVLSQTLYLLSAPTVNVLGAEMTLPANIATGGSLSFACSPITKLIIPEGAVHVPYGAFAGCRDLTAIHFDATDMPDHTGNYLYSMLGAGANGDGVAIRIGEGVTRVPGSHLFHGAKICAITFASGSRCTEIGAHAFQTGYRDGASKNMCTELILPDGLLTIEAYAFIGIGSVTTLSLPDGLTAIGDYAFAGIRSLTSLAIPASVTTLGTSPFSVCTSLTTLTIPRVQDKLATMLGTKPSNLQSVTVLGGTQLAASAFAGYTHLTKVSLPGTLTEIGGSAFKGCTQLESITLPNSVTKLDQYVFRDCAALTNVTLGNALQQIGIGTFFGCTSLADVSLPLTLTSIGNLVFSGCTGLTSIVIPDSVTSVGTNLFKDCADLITATLPAIALSGLPRTIVSITVTSGTSIGANALQNCTKLTSIKIPESVTTIGAYAFSGCTSLSDVALPSALKSIGRYAFQNCAFEQLATPDSVTQIGHGFLAGCPITSLVISPNVTSLKGLLYDVKLLTDLTIPNCDSYTSLYDGTTLAEATIIRLTLRGGTDTFFLDASCTSLETLTITSCAGTILSYDSYGTNCPNLTSVSIGDGVTVINRSSFAGCTRLANVSLPSTLKTIENGAFQNCTSLSEIAIPEGVVTIGSETFQNCKAMEAVSLPSTLKDIGSNAFWGCTNLRSAPLPNGLENLGSGAFANCTALPLTVHESGKYLGNEENPYLALIEATVSTSGFEFLEQTRIIGGNAFEGSSLDVLVIPESIISICDDAFSWSGLVSVTIHCRIIGDRAFYNAHQLQTVVLGENVESIGSDAFVDTGITSITIPDGVTGIGNGAFSSCTSLSSITISNSVTSIGAYAFEGCDDLTVHFMGSKQEWDAIDIGERNDALIYAEIIFAE